MRTLLFAAIGSSAGVLLAYGAAMVWNPDSYERTLPLLLAGALAGALGGAWIARRKLTRPGA